MIDERVIAIMMKRLQCSREEAIEVIQDDEEVDRGGNPHPLTAEQEKASKAARIVSTGPRTAPVKHERKPNEAKREIIQVLDEALTDIADDVTVTNIERQIDFVLDGVRYRVVLSAPRK